ncbi:MAG: hydrogenase iron-sulfur subunit [Candidatus Marinimicrobia bacterium]|nr:hydrogenase iron-sulfur subunit [Candidatus Neomarinimicrobiota bacterium]RKY55640.1 MAG: methyl-viologen-reducing hydrogenase subunit delta [Candidatus Neomarinimicrobiota bacterium]
MYEPKIVAFFCKWCTSAGADLAGTSRLNYKPNITGIRVMCSSRVDPEHVLDAFKNGADGVLIGGCHPGDCHYQSGNYQTLKRVKLLKKMLKDLNINENRLRLEWISAAEGKRFAEVVDEFTEETRALGEIQYTPL